MPISSLAYTVQMDQNASFAERFSMGASTLLFGMLVVFSVLILIWGILELFHVIFASTQKKDQKPTPAPKVQPPIAPTPVAVTPAAADDTAIIAAITAAIMMMNQQDATSFRVVSFRRINKNTPWNRE